MIIRYAKSRSVCLFCLVTVLMLAPGTTATGSDTLFLDIPLKQERCTPSGDVCVDYDSLLSDSRCPIGVICVWGGSAEVRLLVNKDTVRLNTYDSSSKVLGKTGYTIRLTEVHPYPIFGYPDRISEHERYLISRRDAAVEVALMRSSVQVNHRKAAPVLSRLTVSGSNRIGYEIPCVSHIVIQVFTIQGEYINTIVDKYSGPGFYTVAFPPAKSHGRYVIKMQTERETIVWPVYYTR